MSTDVERSWQHERDLLEPIKHLVVVMLENRSFDHMLGYLALPGHQLDDHGELPTTVNGLDLGFANLDDADRAHTPEPMDEEAFLMLGVDPPHDVSHVAKQLAGGKMTGFVKAFADSLRQKGQPDLADNPDVIKNVMGYMTPERVPVYHHLARTFCICDRWFCSVPGPTLLNRFYAVAGTTRGATSNNDLIRHHFGKFESLFRYLDAQWRWYSSDPGILRAVDSCFMFDDKNDHFAYFDQLTEAQPRSFLRDVLGDSANDPALPAVSWIDPNFNMKDIVGFQIDGPGSDDDHPPAPVIRGQKLVHKIYAALSRSIYRDKFLLVVTYDEHGGFCDHERPPHGKGPRVPALLVSPHVKRGVCSTPFDHAALIKTILLLFGKPGSIGEMPDSVAAANDLSVALRSDGKRVELTDVPDAGGASLNPGDLTPAFLPHDGSTLARTFAFADAHLTDLQHDIIHGIAIPLRKGYRLFRHLIAHDSTAKAVRFVPRRRKRLKPRRP